MGPIGGEQGGNFTQPIALAGGTAATVPRWGDYQSAAIDPLDPSVVWTAGQVADDLGSGKPYNWATHIDAVGLTSTGPGVLQGQVYPGFTYRGRTHQNRKITILPAGGGSHIADATARLDLRCRRGRDTVDYQIAAEARQPIRPGGRFYTHRNWGGDRYARSYALTLQGSFNAQGIVSGTVTGNELSRKLGPCKASNIRFQAHL